MPACFTRRYFRPTLALAVYMALNIALLLSSYTVVCWTSRPRDVQTSVLAPSAASDVNIEHDWYNHAQKLYDDTAYTVNVPFLTVVDDNMVGSVDMSSMTCICIAANHMIFCICKRTAAIYKQQHTMEFYVTDNDNFVHQTMDTQSTSGAKEDRLEGFRQLVKEINSWADDVTDVSPSVLLHTRKLHLMLFGQFNTVHRHRRNTALHP